VEMERTEEGTPSGLRGKHQYFELPSSGLRLHYRYAPGDDPETPCIALLHGFLSHIGTWDKVFDCLQKETGLGVIAWDRPAFGYSERLPFKNSTVPGTERQPTDPYTNEYSVQCGMELLESLSIKRAVFVGNSAGGTVAIETLLGTQDTGLVAALVLLDPAVFTSGPPRFVSSMMSLSLFDYVGPWSLRKFISFPSLAKRAYFDQNLVKDASLKHMYEDPWKTPDDGVATATLWHFSKVNFRTMNLRKDKLTSCDTFEAMSAVPVCVITGDSDRIVPVNETKRVAFAVRGSEYHEIPECGHVPQEEKPDEVITIIAQFLKKRVLQSDNDRKDGKTETAYSGS